MACALAGRFRSALGERLVSDAAIQADQQAIAARTAVRAGGPASVILEFARIRETKQCRCTFRLPTDSEIRPRSNFVWR
jgi:hypothetical protein